MGVMASPWRRAPRPQPKYLATARAWLRDTNRYWRYRRGPSTSRERQSVARRRHVVLRTVPRLVWRRCADYADVGINGSMPGSGLCRVQHWRGAFRAGNGQFGACQVGIIRLSSHSAARGGDAGGGRPGPADDRATGWAHGPVSNPTSRVALWPGSTHRSSWVQTAQRTRRCRSRLSGFPRCWFWPASAPSGSTRIGMLASRPRCSASTSRPMCGAPCRLSAAVPTNS